MGGSNLPINETGDYDDQVPLKHPNERKPEYPSSPWIRIVGNPQGFPEGERHPTPRGRGGAPAQPAAGIQQVAFFPQLREPPTDLSLVRKFYQWLMGPPPSSPGGGVVVKNAPGHALEGRNCKNAKNLRYKNILMGGVKKLGASGLSLILVSLSF